MAKIADSTNMRTRETSAQRSRLGGKEKPEVVPAVEGSQSEFKPEATTMAVASAHGIRPSVILRHEGILKNLNSKRQVVASSQPLAFLPPVRAGTNVSTVEKRTGREGRELQKKSARTLQRARSISS